MNYLMTANTYFKNVFGSVKQTSAKQVFMVFAGFILLTFASQLSIPLKPVPLTFQSITVIFIGMTFGARTGVYIVSAYFLAGICGLPVFADFSAGIHKFFGPTGGYLAAFLPAVFVSGYLAERGFAKNILLSFITGIVATAIIIGCGLTYLASLIGFQSAIQFGVMPFIVSEIFKLAVLALLVPKIRKQSQQ